MNLLWEYKDMIPSKEQKWSQKHGIFLPRLRRLEGTCRNLQKRVSDFLKLPSDLIQILAPPRFMPHAMITILRILQVWVFNETLFQFDPTTIPRENLQSDQFVVPLWRDRIETENLDQIYVEKDRHPFSLLGESSVETKGSFPLGDEHKSGRLNILDLLEERLISYATHKVVELVVIAFKDAKILYFPTVARSEILSALPDLNEDNNGTMTLSATLKGKILRGRDERSCGRYSVTEHRQGRPAGTDEESHHWSRILFSNNHKTAMRKYELYFEANMSKRLLVNFSVDTVIDLSKIKVLKFSLLLNGFSNGMSDLDVKDLFASTNISSTKHIQPVPQKLVFSYIPNNMVPDKANSATNNSSVNRPLIQCIPEGARLLSVVASSRRGKETVVCLSTKDKVKNDKKGSDDAKNTTSDKKDVLEVCIDSKQMNIMQRWKRFGTTRSQVYVDPNSVPGSAVPMYGKEMLYCTCSDTLEVRGGGLRANGGLTLLPPGKLYLKLCRLTFGLYKQENVDDECYIDEILEPLNAEGTKETKKILKRRIKRAVNFNESSIELGEQLQCFPEKITMLLQIFDGVDGYECTVWNELKYNPFVQSNLENLRRSMQEKQDVVELEQRTARLMME
jgi:hypothetical protein